MRRINGIIHYFSYENVMFIYISKKREKQGNLKATENNK